MHAAADKNKEEICKLLIDNKANINPRNKKGTTPLLGASFFGCEEVRELLLE